MQQLVLLLGVPDVSLQQEGVHLGVDVLDSDLEAVEGASLGDLDLAHEANTQVFIDNAVGCCEKGEDVGDEVALVVVEGLPVLVVAAKIDFFGCREGRRGTQEGCSEVVGDGV